MSRSPAPRTLLLAFNFPPLGGGIARWMGELARHYPPHSLIVSTGRHRGSETSDPEFPQPIDHAPIRATRLRTLNGLVLWSARAGRLVRRSRPGFAWCGELKPAAYPARWLRARYGLPYGVVVHGTELLLLDAKMRRSRWQRWAARELLGGAAVVVANSQWTAGLARAALTALERPALAADVRVVPPGTTPSAFRPDIDPRPIRAKYGLADGPWLLTVSRLDWHKGIDTVIKALPAVRAALPAAPPRYAVAGVGARRADLERLVGDLGLTGAVRWLGFVPDADLPALYNAVDLYVGASRRVGLLAEGFGIALLEAAASGLAVVGGRSGGVPDAVRDGETGTLVDPEDPAAVARAITALLGDPERRRAMGAAGRRAVETYYNWDRVARDLLQIDRELRLT
ncbi:MAG TPA: glycosyltransferase family 4 protein [Gemmatimonadales bacterium]|nr:glycosyltransferase family 4 protein [Gemmatimonadales bacterium]